MVPHWQRRSVWESGASHLGSHSASAKSRHPGWRCLAWYGMGVLCFLMAASGIFFLFFNALWPLARLMPSWVESPVKVAAMLLFVIMLLVAASSWWLIGQGVRSIERARQLREGDFTDETIAPNAGN